MSIYSETMNKLHTCVTPEDVIAGAAARPRKRVRPAVVIPAAVLGAIAISAVTVGTACSWDFRTLVVGDYARNRRETALHSGDHIGAEEQLFMYGEGVEIPEGMRNHHEMTDEEIRMLERLSVNIDKTFECDEFSFKFCGLMYDGSVLRVQWTLIRNDGDIDVHKDDTQFLICIGEDVKTSCQGYGLDGFESDRMTSTSEWWITEPKSPDSVTLILYRFTSDGKTECGRLTVRLPDTSGLTRTYKLDGQTRLGNYGTSNLKSIMFRPFGVYLDFDFNLDGSIKDYNSVHIGHPPVYIFMENGAIIGFQNVFGSAGGWGNRAVNDDGSFYHGWQISQDNYIIDAFSVSAVQIGNEIIELDDSMIIE